MRTPLLLLTLTLLAGCGDDPPPAPAPEAPLPEALPEAPQLSYTAGHLSVAQRGVPLDNEDLAIIVEGGQITPADVMGDFGLLVLNRPYYDRLYGQYFWGDWTPTGDLAECADTHAPVRCTQPAATATALLAQIKTRGIEFDRVAVNVDLLVPKRTALLHPELQTASTARFDLFEHRQAVAEAFGALARVPGVAYITVGLEMNVYYQLLDPQNERQIDDYTNYITLYRRIYEEIKAVNPDVKVGPGIRWANFMIYGVPEIANELGLAPDSLEAVYKASQRIIAPLLSYRALEGGGRVEIKTADYLAVTLMPFESEPPFMGISRPQSEIEKAGISAYYQYIGLVAGGLPLVIPQIDWRTSGDKTGFLETVKGYLSPFEVEWISWRRFADITAVPEANRCAAFTQAQPEALQYSADYCTSGLVEETGKRRGVYDTLTTDP
ncbi:hypothetical protein KKB55_06535 [Myxococcota bacterium]|nr:hypothetical protein [Myxococcota bacterium]MBU1897411.1 hypothetical protein [Myxococcota bacterium]